MGEEEEGSKAHDRLEQQRRYGVLFATVANWTTAHHIWQYTL